MSDQAYCPHCDAELSAEISPEELCPDCLMQLGLEDWSSSGDGGEPELESTVGAEFLTTFAPVGPAPAAQSHKTT